MRSYKIAEAARLLGVSDDTLRRWVEQDLLPTTGATPAEIALCGFAPRRSSSNFYIHRLLLILKLVN